MPRVNERLSFPFSIDIGGFGVGSELTSSGKVGVNYLFTRHIMAEAGYVYTYVDYRQRGAVFDITLAGPYLAFGYFF